MNNYEKITEIYCNTKDTYIRSNIETMHTLLSVVIEFIDNSETVNRIALATLVKSIESVFEYSMFRYDAYYDECILAFYDAINDKLLRTVTYNTTTNYVYYDIDSKAFRRIEKIFSDYRKETKATYNLDAYINQYIDFYDNI